MIRLQDFLAMIRAIELHNRIRRVGELSFGAKALGVQTYEHELSYYTGGSRVQSLSHKLDTRHDV